MRYRCAGFTGMMLWTFVASACGASLEEPCPWCDASGVVPTTRMTMSRAAQSAVRLADGRVLVLGGCVRDGCTAGPGSRSSEIFDPRNGRFTPGPELRTPRSGDQVVARLNDGRVLVVGGWSGEAYLAAAEIYDPATNQFEPTGSMSTARGSPTATLLHDGRVLIAGGYAARDRIASAELYDPATGHFLPTGAMTTARSAHAATLLADGRVLITGGDSARGAVLASAEIYDPATGRFTRTGDMTEVRYKHAAVALADGRVLIVGGSGAGDWGDKLATAELYDPATDRFASTGRMHYARFKIPFAAVLLANGRVLVGGGAERVELFDPTSGAFALVTGTLDAGRQFSTATLLSDGRVLIAGGYDDRGRLTSGAWVYAVAR